MVSEKNILVLGLGASGMAAAEMMASEGASVTVIDGDDSDLLRNRGAELTTGGVTVVLQAEAIPELPFDQCIVSPGVPVDSDWVRELRRRGVPWVSELEVGWRRHRGRTLAVTGSNGKSTAVKWCRDALAGQGFSAALAGNFGPPVCRVVREQPGLEWLSLEVSSFQLETVTTFRPDVGVLLNIQPNHLDRHGNMEAYVDAKAKFFSRTNPEDTCVVPEEWKDEMVARSGGQGRWITFGCSGSATYRWRDGRVFHEDAPVVSLQGSLFDNEILGVTAAGIVAALRACDVDAETAGEAARRLQPLPHRMQEVGRLGGVRFIDDSKATSLPAMEAALKMTPEPVRLIAGGIPKDTAFNSLKEVLVERVRSVYLIGKSSGAFASAWSGTVPCIPCGRLEEAVCRAWGDAETGEAILLSPGCASFDQFRNFEHRGDVFREAVQNLAEEEAP